MEQKCVYGFTVDTKLIMTPKAYHCADLLYRVRKGIKNKCSETTISWQYAVY